MKTLSPSPHGRPSRGRARRLLPAARTCAPRRTSRPKSADQHRRRTPASWRMIVLTGPTQIAVAPPAAVTSDAYKAELDAIKDGAGQPHGRAAREHRRTGAAAASCAGTRSCASWWPATTCRRRRATTAPTSSRTANNPFADPEFPFSNPPYAARAYSYVAVAQFEALKVGLVLQVPVQPPVARARSTAASSPSCLRATCPPTRRRTRCCRASSQQMLKLLFPAAVEEITREGRRPAGRRTLVGPGRRRATSRRGWPSGKAVAAVLARARPRPTACGAAIGTKAQWDAFAAKAAAQGRDPLDEPGDAGPAAHAPVLRPGEGLGHDADRHRGRAARPAALHLLGADAAGAGGGQDATRTARPASRWRSPTSGPTASAPTLRPDTGTTSPPSTSATPATARCGRRAPSPC